MAEPRPILTDDPAAFVREIAGGRLLGLDVGSKQIGLALSDAARSIASPLLVLARRKFTLDAEAILALAEEHRIAGLVVGLPVNMDASHGDAARSVRTFAFNLQRSVPLGVLLWDERLSTSAVTRTLLEADMTRARRAQTIDKLAAAFILQGALDRLRALV